MIAWWVASVLSSSHPPSGECNCGNINLRSPQILSTHSPNLIEMCSRPATDGFFYHLCYCPHSHVYESVYLYIFIGV